MKYLLQTFVASLLLLLFLLTPCPTFAQDPANVKTPDDNSKSPAGDAVKSIVRGKVIYEETSKPLRRVRISLHDPAGFDRSHYFSGWTNGRGEFTFKDVPKGKYLITVDAQSILRLDYFSSEEQIKAGPFVTVASSEPVETIVKVKHSSAISGKISYPDGDPAEGVAIRVLKKKDEKWVPASYYTENSDRVLTDDRGIYRITGLAPGEYLIGAAEQKMSEELTERATKGGPGTFLNRALLATTFYPGANDEEGATLLQLGPGEEKSNIDITLAETTSHSISGVVTLKGERTPVNRARISLSNVKKKNAYQYDLEDPVTSSDEQGRFTFDEIPEGSYRMTITPARPSPREDYGTQESAPAGVRKFTVKKQTLDVTGDVANLLIEVSTGGRISGTVAMDGGRALPKNVMIVTEMGPGRREEQVSTRIADNGSFTLEGVPAGDLRLGARVIGGAPNVYVKSVTAGGADLKREPLKFEDSSDVKGVRIVLSDEVSTLTGRVVDPTDGHGVSGAIVMLIPVDEGLREVQSMRLGAITNADGEFMLKGAPGEYLALTYRRNAAFRGGMDEMIKNLLPKASRVILNSNERKTITLNISVDH